MKNGSPKWRESNIAYWVRDTEKMATQVYQGFTQATRDASNRSVESEWKPNAIKVAQAKSPLEY